MSSPEMNTQILEGFIPLHAIPYSPNSFGELMAQRYGIPVGMSQPNLPVGDGRRADRDAMVNGDLARWSTRFRSLQYFNQILDASGEVVSHVDISEDLEQRQVLQETLARLAQNNCIRVITPFVDEAKTAELAASYNAYLVGTENVVPVEAGLTDLKRQEGRINAIQAIQNAGMEVVHQPQALNGINWRAIRQAFNILPQPKTHESEVEFKARYEQEMDQPPTGSKGQTMLAGILTLFARDKLARYNRETGQSYNSHDLLEDDAWVIFHDTDIQNVETYAATEYLAFALTYSQSPNTDRTIQIARHGQGRNNHPMMHTASLLTNPRIMPNEKVQQMGRTIESLSWHLSGERAIRWGELKNMPWVSGMGIETWINMWFASRDIMEVNRGVAQVANPNPKIEEGISDPRREHTMIYGLAEWMLETANFAAENNSLPAEWDNDMLVKYNTELGGQPYSVVTPGSTSESGVHAQMVDSERSAEFLIPSMNTMFEMGAFDVYATLGIS